jgi:NAD(P)-dependent dehydrogenase (short-subunit alcohol dehydrogenase family)
MLLEHKNAIVYGGGGSVGGAVARTFVREGAKIFLAGCTLARVEAVAQDRRFAPGDGQHGTVYGVEKRVSSDCGSEGRGFESRRSPSYRLPAYSRKLSPIGDPHARCGALLKATGGAT